MIAIQAPNPNKLELVETLVWSGADITVTDKEGSNAVHYAAMSGDVDVLEFLLNQKPELINTKDGADQSPIFYAGLESKLEAFRFLKARGADITVVSTENKSLLHLIAPKSIDDTSPWSKEYAQLEKSGKIQIDLKDGTDGSGKTAAKLKEEARTQHENSHSDCGTIRDRYHAMKQARLERTG